EIRARKEAFLRHVLNQWLHVAIAIGDTPGGKPVSLDDRDRDVLQALQDRAPQALKIADLAETAAISRRALQPRIRRLIELGLVTRKGKRQGVTITTLGSEWLRRITSG